MDKKRPLEGDYDGDRPAKQPKLAETDNADASLTPEMLQKIEANRLAALAKRQQREQQKMAAQGPASPQSFIKQPARTPTKPPMMNRITNYFSPQKTSAPATTTSPDDNTQLASKTMDSMDVEAPAPKQIISPPRQNVVPSSPNPNIQSTFSPPRQTVAQTQSRGAPRTPQSSSVETPTVSSTTTFSFDQFTFTARQYNPSPAANRSRVNRRILFEDDDYQSQAINTQTSTQNTVSSTPSSITSESFELPEPSEATRAAFAKAVRKATSSAAGNGDENDSEKPGRPDWLANPRDAQMRKPGDPLYDPTTLYIPPHEFSKLTAAKQMYYSIKRNNFDTVVFFQQGSFFNLFGHDADISVREFNFVYNPKLDSTGFNINQLDDWIAKFVSRGYPVMVVEQKNTAETELEKSAKKSTKKATEERHTTQRVTYGTIRNFDMIDDPRARYILILMEQANDDGSSDYGICFVDVSTYEFGVGVLHDDEKSLALETLLLRLQPAEVLYDRLQTTQKTKKLVQLSSSRQRQVITTRIFPSAQETRDWLDRRGLFLTPETTPPEIAALSSNELFMRALGGTLLYFEELLFVDELVPRANYVAYNHGYNAKHLLLDAITLTNLEILENNDTRSQSGALLGELNHCMTPFGRRRLTRWLCHPLRRVNEINERLDCVEYFINRHHICDRIRDNLRTIKDVERMITRVLSCAATLTQFISFLIGMEKIQDAIGTAYQLISEENEKGSSLPSLIHKLVFQFPDLTAFFQAFNFDKKEALERGKISIPPGLMPEYDAIVQRKAEIEAELESFLNELKRELKVSSLNYYHANKDRYLIEISADALKKVSLPKDFERMGGTQKKPRYTCGRVQSLVQSLVETEREIENTEIGFLRSLQERFADHYPHCKMAIDYCADLDAILSLAYYSSISSSERPMCRPHVVQRGEDGSPFFKVVGMRHPYVKPTIGSEFVPNDLTLGADGLAPTILITGPNMGGKSTLLRQVCIVVIMAQIGCFVPAEECSFTTVDRIFTRLGARDNIMAGKSTFFVELEETGKILQNATPDSLVILDELGRGTSTFDGYSIAYAVLKYLEQRKCRVLFSTHYHKLNEEFAQGSQIQQCWMACRLEGGNKEMVPLYKLTPGSCPSSFGLEVAAMAQIPQEVIDRAKEMSSNLSALIAKRKEKKREDQSSSLARLYSLLNGELNSTAISSILILWAKLRKL